MLILLCLVRRAQISLLLLEGGFWRELSGRHNTGTSPGCAAGLHRAIIQHNTSGFASIASKGITSPKDFEGKTYGGWGAPLEQAVLQSLMQKEKADINKLDIVNAGDLDFFTMMEKDIDFAWIYYAWTGIEAESRGEKINMLYLTDYSDQLDYYTPVLATNEKMIQDNPDVVKAFVAMHRRAMNTQLKTQVKRLIF